MVKLHGQETEFGSTKLGTREWKQIQSKGTTDHPGTTSGANRRNSSHAQTGRTRSGPCTAFLAEPRFYTFMLGNFVSSLY